MTSPVSGIDISSRLDDPREVRVMTLVCGAMPPKLARFIKSVFCDSKAGSCFSAEINATSEDVAYEIGYELEQGFLRLNGGHSGIWVSGPDGINVYRAPSWPDDSDEPGPDVAAAAPAQIGRDPPPRIELPSRLNGEGIYRVTKAIADACPAGLPARLDFDMTNLGFVRPSGAVFLSNLVSWMTMKGCEVSFVGTGASGKRPDGVAYLDDAQFFVTHAGKPLRIGASPYRSMQPLLKIRGEVVHGWLELTLMPWMSALLNLSTATLADFKVCISEIFNNIVDHSTNDIGCILVQHNAKENRVWIGVADWGVGIPTTVRRVAPDLADDYATIKRAVEQGFSSKSLPTNQGAGLPHLLDKVVRANGGSVTIMSSRGRVQFQRSPSGAILPIAASAGFCPGTIVEIQLRTDTIERVSDEREDMQWPG